MYIRCNAVVVGVVFLASAAMALAQDTMFTYQGRLLDGGAPANGAYDINVGLWDAVSGGTQIGSTIALPGVAVEEGLFTVELDYGADAFDNSSRWVEVEVNSVTLTPRQPITRAPYALQTRGMVVDENEKIGMGVTPGGARLRAWNLAGQAIDATASGRAVEAISTGGDIAILASNQAPDGIGLYAQNQPAGNYGWVGSDTHGVYGYATGSDEWGGYFVGRGYFSGTTLIGRTQAITSAEVFGIYGPSQSGYNGMYVSTAGEDAWPFYGYAAGGTSDMWHYYDGATRKWHVYNNGIQLTVTGYGRVGVGTLDPIGRMSIEANEGDPQAALWVHHKQTTSQQTYGIYSQSDNPDAGAGVLGQANAGSGFGVRGFSHGEQGTGVDGVASASTGRNYGVKGKSNSPSGYDFYAYGAGINYGSSSSGRWKSNVVRISSPLEKVGRLRGVYFDWDAEHGGQHDVGMIAEEVGAVLPEIVNYEANGIDASGMDYSKMTPLLVEAVNELRRVVDEKADEIAWLRGENAALQDRLARLERLVSRLTLAQQEEISE